MALNQPSLSENMSLSSSSRNDSEGETALMELWSDMPPDYSGIPSDLQYRLAMNKCIHEIFDGQALVRHSATALICGEQKLSYGELRLRAMSLASEIRKSGAEHESVIGIYISRSIESIISMLAALYAGGAYLPLDPLFPDDRIRFMIEDSRAVLLLADRQGFERAKSFSDRVLMVDANSPIPLIHDNATITGPATPESLVYIMYTSGSTGTPKGVEILHKGIVRLVYGDYVEFGPGQTFLHMSTPSFDASTFEIWGALLHGGTLVILRERVPGIRDLRKAIADNKVTTALLTASYFNTVIDEDADALSGLKQLLVVGEALSVPHIHSALAALPNTTIFNGYGPTENTAGTCSYTIPRDLDTSVPSIPIGRPFRGNTAYILDPKGHPVAKGEEGELYTGGEGVGRGYLGRPELNETCFLPDPFSGKPDARMYKTGDIVREREDGIIEFIGRIDDQVKIRGFRAEPSEVQTVLAAQPSVRNALVLPKADFTNTKHLVAYIVPMQDDGFDEEALRNAVEQRLPEFMHPSFYIRIEAIPLKVNGKADRGALPSPWGLDGRLQEDDYADAMEITIARTWFAVLGSIVIQRDMNVFESGAKSIHAVRVHQRLQKTLNRDFSITAIFEYPTIQTLANHLRADYGGAEYDPSPIKNRSRKQLSALSRMRHRTNK